MRYRCVGSAGMTKAGYISKWCGKILHIYDPVFMQNFYYVKAKTEREFAEKIRSVVKIEPSKREPSAGFKVIMSGKKGDHEVCLIWGGGQDLIAHEVVHAVHYVLSRKGIPLNDDTTEVYAYYAQFLMRHVCGG